MVVVERGDGARLRPLLATLLRLRVAVHVLQLPSASQPEDELRLLGWSQAQGIFTYPGSVQEQWTALLSSQPAPPLRFGLLLLSSLSDVTRQLHQPHCLLSPPGPRCVWGGVAPPGSVQPAAPVASLRRLGRLASRAELASLMGEPSTGATGAGGANATASEHEVEEEGEEGGGGAEEEEEGEVAAAEKNAEAEPEADSIWEGDSISLLRLLDCMRRAQRLPLLVLPSSLLSLRLHRLTRHLPPPLAASPSGAASDAAALLALSSQWEVAVLGRAEGGGRDLSWGA